MDVVLKYTHIDTHKATDTDSDSDTRMYLSKPYNVAKTNRSDCADVLLIATQT